jgi:predicted NAD-dependent protein-ADP-ribosyltransferase YbiA (DUF1768 family)
MPFLRGTKAIQPGSKSCESAFSPYVVPRMANVIGRCVSQLAETWLGSHRRVEFEAKAIKFEQRRVLISFLVEAG